MKLEALGHFRRRFGGGPDHIIQKLFEIFQAGRRNDDGIAPAPDIFGDSQYAAREAITTVEHETLGPVRGPGLVSRLVATPGAVRHLGRAPGADNDAVFTGRLGHSAGELAAWREQRVI